MNPCRRLAIVMLLSFGGVAPCLGLPTSDSDEGFHKVILPFMESGQQFSFPSQDHHYQLSGVRFLHPRAGGSKGKGLVVVLNGFGQSWRQYGELFHDLYHEGYDVISYDHRGQGLSPHLVPFNSQIGYIKNFHDYSADFNSFMERVVKPLHPDASSRFLVANSMGGAIAALYLEEHPSPPPHSPFAAAALSAPMFEINTAPYPPWIAHLIVGTMNGIGLGRHYAIGMHDFDPKASFGENRITHNLVRWRADREVKLLYPRSVIGGPSNGWVNTSLSTTQHIRSHLSSITVPTLLLQAGQDQLVMNQPITKAAAEIPRCRLMSFPDSRHGILMEGDSIRKKAMKEIEGFFARESCLHQ